MNIEAVPRVLILETSSRTAHVALALGDELRGVRRLEETRRHARELTPALAALLAEQSWRPRDVQAVIVSRGPGSYTGLRVGIMSAKTFAYATGCVLLAVDTFAAVARQTPASVARVDVVADAQQDKVYVQSFLRSTEGWQPSSALAIRRVADWLAAREASAWVTGPGLHKWAARLPAEVPIVEASLWEPQPASLLGIGLARYRAGQRDDLWTLEPLYLRPSSAEEQWRGRSS
ncbi:MAG TPA: tRNA (adenosine(37)-N6)-threonylcarbamoyltransferase complex dimerization subunit type 1 TsaB [Gemmataceae bacterium]|nr:tRNA (adenosine(37)-N6)-threonylcarbamoyltransferase complex dimerization subunit type 1 TsaB [Gemmataceae bacterium]